MTSIPYWGLRDYQVEGQIGLESSFHEYLDKITAIFSETKRVLKKTGSCYINVGDVYAGSKNWQNAPQRPRDGPKSFKGRHEGYSNRVIREFPSKALIGMPERLYIRMMDIGWIPRNKIIWHKPNHMPSSVKDRLSPSYEFVYHFVKSQRYFYDLDKIREPWAQVTIDRVKAAIKNQETFDPTRHKSDTALPGHPRAQSPMEVLTGIAKRKAKFNVRVRDLQANRVKGPDWKVHGDGSEVLEYDEKTYGLTKHDIAVGRTSGSYSDPLHRKEKLLRKQDSVPGPNSGTYKGFNDRWRQKSAQLPHPNQFARNNHSNVFDENGNLLIDFSVGKNPGDVWKISTRGHPFAHFAVFPLALVYRPMISSSPPGSVTMDPFCGSGTVALMAEMLRRKFIGIELNPEYIKIAWQRINQLRAEAAALQKILGPKLEQAGALDKFVEASC